jgi:non-heme chloroperoxidase
MKCSSLKKLARWFFGDLRAAASRGVIMGGKHRMSCQKILLFVALSLSPAVQALAGRADTQAAIRDKYCALGDGIRIHYLESGADSGAPDLVLIPGWRLPAFLWDEQLRTFSAMTRVIAIDPRSQGESSKTSDGNTPESRARDLHELLEELNVHRFVLVGWSQGSQDVAAYLEQFGTDSVDGVVFVDSPVSWGSSEIDAHKEFAKSILSGIAIYAVHPREYSEGMARSILKKRHPDLDLQRVVTSTLQTPTDIGIAMLVADIFGADRRPALAKLDKPTLVIASADSPLLDVQKQMVASIPRSRFLAIEGAGHAVFIDEPQKFDDALRDLFRAITRK